MKKAEKGGKKPDSVPSPPNYKGIFCPFKEFKDADLALADQWGVNNATTGETKKNYLSKLALGDEWVDTQVQSMPRSIRTMVSGWAKADVFAKEYYDAEIDIVLEEKNDPTSGRMKMREIQDDYDEILSLSSFCRRVLSACYILERLEPMTVDHQWDGFISMYGNEGWRPKYHIYSPGLKSGGGPLHKPVISKSGCYLVRLYYLGCWRCVWVDDTLPFDALEQPLLPFAPIFRPQPQPTTAKVKSAKSAKSSRTSISMDRIVIIWPLLMIKALLKLAAPNDYYGDIYDDEALEHFDEYHALTGCLRIARNARSMSPDSIWEIMLKDVKLFTWEDEMKTQGSIKPKQGKRNLSPKIDDVKKYNPVLIQIRDSANVEPYVLSGISPGFEHNALVQLARDLPLKKPPSEPELARWKYIRWLDWARQHGLYDEYYCPRTKYIKVDSLLRLSRRPSLLDVRSAQSLTVTKTRIGADKSLPKYKKHFIHGGSSGSLNEIIESVWIDFMQVCSFMKNLSVMYQIQQYNSVGITNAPPIRPVPSKLPGVPTYVRIDSNRPIFVTVDSFKEINIRIDFEYLSRTVLQNCNVPFNKTLFPGFLVLEKFYWLEDSTKSKVVTSMKTEGYCFNEFTLPLGRHFFRLWVNGESPFHSWLQTDPDANISVSSMSEAMSLAETECKWVPGKINEVAKTFQSFLKAKIDKSIAVCTAAKEFYMSYKPDREWETDIIGFPESLINWMMRLTMQELLRTRLDSQDYQLVCQELRKYFRDPEFGYMNKSEAKVYLPLFYLKLVKADTDSVITSSRLISSPELLRDNTIPSTKYYLSQENAALTIEKHWRGYRARKVLSSSTITVDQDALKVAQDTLFNGQFGCSALFTKFFHLFPGTESAFTFSDALAGLYFIQQFSGTTHAIPNGNWVQLSNGLLYSHIPVLVIFNLTCSLPYNSLTLYNNDTDECIVLPAHFDKVYELHPNVHGYNLYAQTWIRDEPYRNEAITWNLKMMSSIPNAVFFCNNPINCVRTNLETSKMSFSDELFLPNTDNILTIARVTPRSGVYLNIRITTNFPYVKLRASIQGMSDKEPLAECEGFGEIIWSNFKLEEEEAKANESLVSQTSAISVKSLKGQRSKSPSKRNLASKPSTSASKKSKQPVRHGTSEKQYIITVIAPDGWPLTVTQWKRVIEIRNYAESQISPRQLQQQQQQRTPVHVKGVHFRQQQDHKYEVKVDDPFCRVEIGHIADVEVVLARDKTRVNEWLSILEMWFSAPSRYENGIEMRRVFRDKFLLQTPQKEIVEGSITSDIRSKDTHMSLHYVSAESSTTIKKKSKRSRSALHKSDSKYSAATLTRPSDNDRFLQMPTTLKEEFKPYFYLPNVYQMKERAIIYNMAEEQQKRREEYEYAVETQKMYGDHILEIYANIRSKNIVLNKITEECKWDERFEEVFNNRFACIEANYESFVQNAARGHKSKSKLSSTLQTT